MSITFTAEGLEIETFDEIYNDLADSYRNIYGQDIDLDPNTPDGQRVGNEAQARLNDQVALLDLYNQMDVDLSNGDAQNRIIKIAGITRLPASKSQADVVIECSSAGIIEDGYPVKDDLDQVWMLDGDLSVVAGSNNATLFAELWGKIEADAGTITNPAEVDLKVVSVTNPLAASPGRDEEMPEELRIRRNKSVRNPAYSTTGGLFAKLGNLSGVTDLQVYENKKSSYDSVRDMQSHSIWAIVEGGDIADIVEVLAKNKTGGTGEKGSVTGIYNETIILDSGSEYTIVHEMAFDRPAEVPMYVNITATRRDPLSPIDAVLIAEELAKATYTIGEDALASGLYGFGYNAGSNFILSELQISDDNITFTDEGLTSGFGSKFTIDTTNIAVTEVV